MHEQQCPNEPQVLGLNFEDWAMLVCNWALFGYGVRLFLRRCRKVWDFKLLISGNAALVQRFAVDRVFRRSVLGLELGTQL